MKILLCTNAFENVTNGPAKFANLILKINKEYPEHEVRVLSEDISVSGYLIYRAPIVVPFFLKPIGQVIRMFQYHNEAMRIRKKDFKFDVLVYNNAFIGLWSALLFSKTVGFINDYSNAHASLYKVLINKSPFKRFVFKQLEYLSTFFLKKVITNSDFMTRELNSIYSISESKSVRLYKAIENPSQIKTSTSLLLPVQLLFVKTDDRTGGLQDLFNALKIVDFEYHLTVVGLKFNRILDLQKIVDSMSLNCTLQGQKSPQEVYLLMLKSDVFCVPSHKEALGVANIEAMARGLAVVTTNVGGIPEVLDGGNNGWLVDMSDPISLSKALNECVNNNELRAQKINQAMLFSTRFSERNMFEKFIKIISTVVNE